MNGNSVVALVVAALTNSQIDYMLVGSYSSNAYGFPRATNDMDFVVQLAPGAITKLMRTLGKEFELVSQIQFETITGTIRRVITFAPIDNKMDGICLTVTSHGNQKTSRRLFPGFRWNRLLKKCEQIS